MKTLFPDWLGVGLLGGLGLLFWISPIATIAWEIWQNGGRKEKTSQALIEKFWNATDENYAAVLFFISLGGCWIVLDKFHLNPWWSFPLALVTCCLLSALWVLSAVLIWRVIYELARRFNPQKE